MFLSAVVVVGGFLVALVLLLRFAKGYRDVHLKLGCARLLHAEVDLKSPRHRSDK